MSGQAIAYVFPGQGSQRIGMAKDLHNRYAEVRELFAEASDVLGYDVATLSFAGPAEEINRTHRTQPCLLTASIACETALRLSGVSPGMVAGHSLGEYSALVAAGSLAFGDAVRLTEIRGRIMQEAVPEGLGLMVAIMGLERQKVDELCRDVSVGFVAVANYNCPGQVVISGDKAGVQDAMQKAEAAGARRVVQLTVSVPSHCRLMAAAGKSLEESLALFCISDAGVPMVCNVSAKVVCTADEIRQSLVRQLSESVLWEDSVRAMVRSGVGTFIEVGPGKVLSGLIKRIDTGVKILNVEDGPSLQKTLTALDRGV